MVYNHILNVLFGAKRYFLLYEYPNQLVRVGDKRLPRHELSTDTYPTEYLAKCKFNRMRDTEPNAFLNSISIHSFRMDSPAINWKPWFESILSRFLGHKYYFVYIVRYGEDMPHYETSTNIFFTYDEARQFYDEKRKVPPIYHKVVGIYSFRSRYPITEHSLWRDRQQGKSLSTTQY